MSDARPITDVTEFVCGKCWSSFSYGDAGVDAGGGNIRCPHCGHVQTAARNITDAVRAAPTTDRDTDSTSFAEVDPGDASATQEATPVESELTDPALDDTAESPVPTPARAAAASVAAPTATEPAAQAKGAAPPEGPARQTAAYGSKSTAVASSAAADAPAAEPAERDTAAFMDAFAPTLDAANVVTQGAQAVSVRGATQVAASVTVGDPVDLAALNEHTDPDLDVEAIVAQISAAEAARPAPESTPKDAFADFSLSDTGDFGEKDDIDDFGATGAFGDSPFGHAADPSVAVNADTGDHPMPETAEPQEWKLKAPPGLTYNFHSLDALMGWASNKDPDVMEISIDGEQWRPFAPFLAAARDGLSGRQSWDVAGGVKILPQRRGQRSAMDDIANVDAIATAQEQLQIAPSLDFAVSADSAELSDAVAAALLSDTLDEAEGTATAEAVHQALDGGAASGLAASASSAAASGAGALAAGAAVATSEWSPGGGSAGEASRPSGSSTAASQTAASQTAASLTSGSQSSVSPTPGSLTPGAESSASQDANAPATRRSSGSVPAASDGRRASGERPRPEKVALTKKDGPPVVAIVAGVIIVGVVVAALVLTGVL